MEKCFSTNNEDFQYTDIEDAIRYALDDPETVAGTVVTVYEGDAIPWKAGDFAPTDVMDRLSEDAYDNAGEYADDWPNCTKEEEKDLDARIEAAVNQWADDHGLQPNFYRVANVKEVQAECLDMEGNFKILEI